MKNETAGDPMTGLKWTRRTTQKIADQLEALGVEVSARTVAVRERAKYPGALHRKGPGTLQPLGPPVLHRKYPRALQPLGPTVTAAM